MTAVQFVIGRRTVCSGDAFSIRRGGLLRQHTVDRPYAPLFSSQGSLREPVKRFGSLVSTHERGGHDRQNEAARTLPAHQFDIKEMITISYALLIICAGSRSERRATCH
ncbi:hypothetical protein [Paraburkholderia sp. BL27I4N3]|uniref:hypothetical protein n=1 Tax=Paraburkholderia sp. BL27I4N3 TaxID=1938805 RepID=UPI000E22E8C7|nr:hypothetical protein [Paraburkholderia sp. BL27I4N3]